MTPAARPPVAARWALLAWTGAAAARFAVKTPAAGKARPSAVATTASSCTYADLVPAAAADRAEHLGALTLTGTPRQAATRWSPPGPSTALAHCTA